MSSYLSNQDQAFYGVDAATPQQVWQASALIDGFLVRPEGLVFASDSRGAPCYMTGADPSGSFALETAIAPGLNVSATVTGWVTPDLVGEVVIAERVPAASTEALVISAVSSQTVTFASVMAPHAAGAALETGLVIMEQRQLPKRRPIARVAKSPIVRLISGLGRYGFGRRSEQFTGYGPEINLLATLQAFGSTPQWIPFDVTQASFSRATDEVWIPAGMYLDYFSEVQLRYVAGYAVAPRPVKQACAALVQSILDFPEAAANVLSIQAGGTAIKKASASLMNPDILSMLSPFDAHQFY